MFNIFHSPLDVIRAPGRDRAAMSVFQRLLMMGAADAAIYSRATKFL
jgi:hypothetical protein